MLTVLAYIAQAIILTAFWVSLNVRTKKFTWLRNALLVNVIFQIASTVLWLLKIHNWFLLLLYMPCSMFCYGKFLIPDKKIYNVINSLFPIIVFLVNVLVFLEKSNEALLMSVVGGYVTILAVINLKKGDTLILIGIIIYNFTAPWILWERTIIMAYSNCAFSIISNIIIVVGLCGLRDLKLSASHSYPLRLF